MTTSDYKLFTPFTLGEGLVLKNRIVHSPLTRARCDVDTHTPTELNALYYEQRADAGLIIAEATAISHQGFGWYGTPGLYTDEQAAEWRKVVERVHARGGKIFLQLWHIGRQGHPSFNAQNELVSASDTLLETGRTRDVNGARGPSQPARALLLSEIPEVVDGYRACAERAKQVGFDGVEVHAANGYLIDSFLQSCTNFRTDHYGGSFENRARLLLQIVEALETVWPADRIGVRLSPNGNFASMGSEDNAEMFIYAMEHLSNRGLAYLAILDGEFLPGAHRSDKSRSLTALDAKKAFKGTVIANNSYTRDIAEGAIRSGATDLVGFGRLFISNPDLVNRFENDWPLNVPVDVKYFWDGTHGAKGYITPPTYAPTNSISVARA